MSGYTTGRVIHNNSIVCPTRRDSRHQQNVHMLDCSGCGYWLPSSVTGRSSGTKIGTIILWSLQRLFSNDGKIAPNSLGIPKSPNSENSESRR